MKNEGESRDSGILSSPLSFLRSGYVNWIDAGVGRQGYNGDYWSLRSGNTIVSYDIYFNNTYMNSQDYSNHGLGFAVRCVAE